MRLTFMAPSGYYEFRGWIKEVWTVYQWSLIRRSVILLYLWKMYCNYFWLSSIGDSVPTTYRQRWLVSTCYAGAVSEQAQTDVIWFIRHGSHNHKARKWTEEKGVLRQVTAAARSGSPCYFCASKGAHNVHFEDIGRGGAIRPSLPQNAHSDWDRKNLEARTKP